MKNPCLKHLKLLVLLILGLAMGQVAWAEPLKPRPWLSGSGMFANDTFFDGQDRWRTGSYQRSFFFQSGEYELRFRSEYITPATLVHPDQNHDRAYASNFQIATIHHEYLGDQDYSIGLSLNAVNQFKSMEKFQNWIHKVTGFGDFDLDGYRVDPSWIGSLEAGWRRDIKQDWGYILPFVEGQLGLRDRLSVGADFLFTQHDYWFFNRDQTTGHLLGYPNDADFVREPIWDFIIGGDVSYVKYDYFLDAPSSNVDNQPFRTRIRLALRETYNNATFFIGPTYLSEEFIGQKEGQFLHSISLEIRF